VPTRVLHLSDLHVGAHWDSEVEAALRTLVAAAAPALVVVTGDLTNRGRREQHERAAEFLRSLGPPVVAVPGNHDIPYTFPARFTRPFAEFERLWETAEPIFRADELIVVGLNSVRPWRHQSGGVRAAQLERAAGALREASADAFRIVALHHHLTNAPWRTRKRPLARRRHVLSELVAAGADLVLAGHVHQSGLSERREFVIADAGARAVVVSTAPGLGRPRPRRAGEASGLHVYEIAPGALLARTHVRCDGGWELVAERRFPRGEAVLTPS
jgi:3',5'-cyclic AMP phosphodiesterase CpdA